MKNNTEIKKYKSVAEAAAELSHATYTGTVTPGGGAIQEEEEEEEEEKENNKIKEDPNKT